MTTEDLQHMPQVDVKVIIKEVLYLITQLILIQQDQGNGER